MINFMYLRYFKKKSHKKNDCITGMKIERFLIQILRRTCLNVQFRHTSKFLDFEENLPNFSHDKTVLEFAMLVFVRD